MTLQEILPFLIPIIVLELALLGIGLYDLTRPDRHVKGGNKLVWGIIIVAFQMVGPLVYFMFGREDS